MGIDAINVGAGNVGSVSPTAGGSGATEVAEAAKVAQEVAIQTALRDAFMIIMASLGNLGAALNAKIQQRIDAIKDLTKLTNDLEKWNEPPVTPKMPADPDDPAYKDRLDKTDELLLNGVGIPQNDYDQVKYMWGDPPRTGYATLPIADFASQKTHVTGELYSFPKDGSPTEKTYARYLYTDINPVLRPASSPLPLNHKTTPGSDFSAYQPGDLVLDEETQKYYRVANDKTGVEVEDYPLQKFIYAPGSDVLYDLKNQIHSKLTEVDNLSKKEAMESQKLSGLVNTTPTEFSNLISAVTAACNSITRNI